MLISINNRLELLNEREYELYQQAEDIVSEAHPYRCVCGRLCTGLHERTCKKFRNAVERKYLRLKKKSSKE